MTQRHKQDLFSSDGKCFIRNLFRRKESGLRGAAAGIRDSQKIHPGRLKFFCGPSAFLPTPEIKNTCRSKAGAKKGSLGRKEVPGKIFISIRESLEIDVIEWQGSDGSAGNLPRPEGVCGAAGHGRKEVSLKARFHFV